MAMITTGDAPVLPAEAQKGNYRPALVALAVLYFMMGFITVLNDTLVPFFRQGFTLSYSQSSLVQFYFFLTYGIMSIPAGKLVERIGYKKGMVAGFLLAALGALLFFPASAFHRYELFLASLFIVAMGIVLLQVAANPYITVLGPPETAASRFTLIQGVGSMGTTLAPLFGAHFILSRISESGASSDAVAYPYLWIGSGLLFIGLSVWGMKLPEIRQAAASTKEKTVGAGILGHRNLKFGLIALFLYVGAEVGLGTFLTNYIADTLSIGEDAANLYLSFFWGGMLAGRFLGAVILRYMPAHRLLVIMATLAAALIGISILSGGLLAVWSIVAVGLCNAIMFATIFSLSVKGLGAGTTRASGLLSTAIVGGAVVSYLQGIIKDHSSWQAAFSLLILSYAYIVFYGWNGYKAKQI